MTEITLHSTKFDGGLHYRYPMRMVEERAERLVTYAEPPATIHSYRGKRMRNWRQLSFFWRDRPYVLHAEWDAQWQPKWLYIDIATATQWGNGVVRYVDLDLDVILPADGSAVRLDDTDEFEVNQKKWNYPSALVTTCWAAVDEVKRLLKDGVGPFRRELFGWREGAKLDP